MITIKTCPHCPGPRTAPSWRSRCWSQSLQVPIWRSCSRTLWPGGKAGWWTSAGITASNIIQGSAAAFGIGTLIVASQPLFTALRWAGIAYLCWLGLHALRSAWHGSDLNAEIGNGASGGGWLVRLRQGLLCNITNPKVLVFYLSVLPQFLGPGHTALPTALMLAYTHAALGLVWLGLLTAILGTVRGWLNRSGIRRSLDVITGLALFGFAGKLATDTT